MPKRKKNKSRSSGNTQKRAVVEHEPVADLLTRSKRFESGLLITAIITATFIWSCSPMQGFDIWWHLKTGQLILENQTLPFVDWYTYSDSEAAWVDLHWGFQILAATTYAAGGVALLILAKAALITATVAIGLLKTGTGLDCWIRASVWSLVAIVLTGRGIVRPEILSMMFLAIWLAILLRANRRPSLLWYLPALLVVWVNCHALFVFGIVIYVTWVADLALRFVAAGRWGLAALQQDTGRNVVTSAGGDQLLATLDREIGTPSAQQVIVVSSLLVIACLMNPYFEEGALFPLVLFRKLSVDKAFYSARVDEFTSPFEFFSQIGLRSIHLDTAALLWLMSAASFLWLARYRRINLFRTLIFVAFSYLAAKMIRNLSPAAIVSGVVLCENLAEIFRLRAASASLSNSDSAEPSPVQNVRSSGWRRSLAISVLLFGLAASHFSGHWGWLTGLGDRFSLSKATAWYAHGAAQFAGQPGFPERAIIASFGQAAVYEFHNAPTHRVLMDGRLEVCSRETFQLYEHILSQMSQAESSWQQLQGLTDRQGRLPAVILDSRFSRDSINGMFQLPNWRLVFADSAAAVFITRELADQLGFPPADPTPLMHPPD